MKIDAKTAAQRNLESITAPLNRQLKSAGITVAYLIKKLKEELEYEEPVRTVDGIIPLRTPAAMRIRQNSRMDAHKLMAHYPAEKVDHNLSGAVTILKPGEIKKPKKSGMTE